MGELSGIEVGDFSGLGWVLKVLRGELAGGFVGLKGLVE